MSLRASVFAAILAALFVIGPACAQSVPDSINYQGKLTDSLGQPVPDGPYQVQFKLYTVDTGDTPFWTSSSVNVTTSGGLFTTQIQPLTAADLAGKTDVWLEIIVSDPNGPQTLSPRM